MLSEEIFTGASSGARSCRLMAAQMQSFAIGRRGDTWLLRPPGKYYNIIRILRVAAPNYALLAYIDNIRVNFDRMVFSVFSCIFLFLMLLFFFYYTRDDLFWNSSVSRVHGPPTVWPHAVALFYNGFCTTVPKLSVEEGIEELWLFVPEEARTKPMFTSQMWPSSLLVSVPGGVQVNRSGSHEGCRLTVEPRAGWNQERELQSTHHLPPRNSVSLDEPTDSWLQNIWYYIFF